jgi:hypothetical protein
MASGVVFVHGAVNEGFGGERGERGKEEREDKIAVKVGKR